MSVAPDLDPPATAAELTVGEVAAASGVAPSAVRFYEKYGIINADRSPSNQRRFDDSAACRIQVAKLAQRVGLSIREIASLFSTLPADPQPSDWRQIADRLMAEAEQRVADLRAHLDSLDSGRKLCEIGAQLNS